MDAKTGYRLEKYWKREERERILGIIEEKAMSMGDSSYENYARKILADIVRTAEANK